MSFKKLLSGRARRLGLLIVFLLWAYAIAGFFVVPIILRPKAEQILTQALHRPTRIGNIAINPFLMKVTVRNFSIAEKKAPWVEFSALTVDFEFASLWRRGPIIRELTLENPQIHITRLSADRYNFSDLLDNKKDSQTTSTEPLPRFSINNIHISGGNIVFDDQYLKSHQEMSELALAIPFLSTLPDLLDDFVEPGLSGKLNGKPFALKGKTKPFEGSHETSLSLNLDHLNLPDYLAYVPFAPGVTLDSGALSTELHLVFRRGHGQQTVLLQGWAGLDEVILSQGRAPIVDVPKFRIEGLALDLGKRQIDVARVMASGGDVKVVRQSDGAINFTRLTQIPPASAPSAPSTGEALPAWRIKVGELALNDFAVSFLDQTLPHAVPIALHDLALKISQIDTTPHASAKLDFSSLAGKRGRLAVAGDFTPIPFAGKWQLDLRLLDAAYSQPYFTQWLNISLASGYASAKGELALATEPTLSGRYQGQLGLSDVHAVDKISGQDFLKWRELDFKGIDTTLAPLKLGVAEIALRDFYSRLIVNKNGRMNLQDIVVQGGKATSVTASNVAEASALKDSAPLPPIRIDRVVLTGGNINYSDNLIQPNFTANLTEMSGVLAGLSSDEKARASLDLRGSVDRIAPVAIAGSLNPFAKKRFVDIKASVKGYELTSASTYAAKYAGYGIEKGKLSLDLAYAVDGQKLKASNQLLLDQLTLGEKSGSPDAIGLPVKFALAILTDRHGQIKVNLPIEGTLNDPEFKVGRVIWGVFVNLMEKTATAPFDALASLVGGDASLSFAEFVPGSADLASKEVVAKLAKALLERPSLKLDISGWVDPESDREGLKYAVLEDKLRARKMALLAGRGESVDEEKIALISKAEYPKLLAEVYAQEGLPAPKAATGSPEAVAEMEKLVLSSIQISSDDLRSLALARAQNAKDALQEAGVADERLFMIAPRLTPNAEQLKGGKPNRTQFVLK